MLLFAVIALVTLRGFLLLFFLKLAPNRSGEQLFMSAPITVVNIIAETAE